MLGIGGIMKSKLFFRFLIVFILIFISLYLFLPRHINISSGEEITIRIKKDGIISEYKYNGAEKIIEELIDQIEKTNLQKVSNIPHFLANETFIISISGLKESAAMWIYLSKDNQGKTYIDYRRGRYRVKNPKDLHAFFKEYFDEIGVTEE
jgi:hypothetical protein